MKSIETMRIFTLCKGFKRLYVFVRLKYNIFCNTENKRNLHDKEMIICQNHYQWPNSIESIDAVTDPCLARSRDKAVILMELGFCERGFSSKIARFLPPWIRERRPWGPCPTGDRDRWPWRSFFSLARRMCQPARSRETSPSGSKRLPVG